MSIVGNSEEINAIARYTNSGNTLSYIMDPLNRTTYYSYNADTNALDWVQYPEDVAQENENRTEYTYDSLGRMLSETAVKEGLDPYVKYAYENARLSTIETVGGVYRFNYGNFGLSSSVSIDGHGTLVGYDYTDDRNNYLEKLAYGNGDRVQYEYDDKGRMTKQSYEDSDSVSYAYDNNGALAKRTDSATGVTTTYYYDLTDRLMKYAESDGDSYSHSVGNEYDKLNNLTQLVEIINGEKHTTSYTYDDDNRVTEFTSGKVGTSYSYDVYGRKSGTMVSYDGGLILNKAYTFQDLRAGEYTSSQVSKYSLAANGYDKTFSYAYDENGNITEIATVVGDEKTVIATYDYDSLNRLIREDSKAENITRIWTYDRIGNIMTRKEYAYTPADTDVSGDPDKTATYGYNTEGWEDLLYSYTETVGEAQEVTSFDYDEIGNLTDDGQWAYTWEHGRQLAQMSRTVDSTEEVWSYTYNADGLRTKRTQTKDGTTTTWEYIYNGSQLVQMTKSSDTLHFTYDANGIPTAVTHNGTTYYYVTNLQGDIIVIVDASGNVVADYAYDAWGNPIPEVGETPTALETLNPLRYRGYVYDGETGLYYLQSRYYDPQIGRFINADGLVSTGQGISGNNMFAYCGNNPANYIDPSGRWLVALACMIVVACAIPLSGCSSQNPHDVHREDLMNAPDLDISSADPNTYNCYGNAIGKQTYTDPYGYTGNETAEEFLGLVENDIGAENVRPLESIDEPLADDEYMVAFKCGTADYHFIRLTENGLYNKASDLNGYYVDPSYVSSSVWVINQYYGPFMLTNKSTYSGATYYFAVKVGWDVQ